MKATGIELGDPFAEARKEKGIIVIDVGDDRIPLILRHRDVRAAARDWSTYSSDAPFRVPVRICGEVRQIRLVPREYATVFEVTIADGTGEAVLSFNGNRRVPGFDPGRRVLAEGVGLDRDYVMSTRGALPATRFACEAYVNFTRNMPLLDAIASSLTELFAPKIHKERIAGLLENYDFANEQTLSYFQKRLDEAPRDVKFGLEYVLREADNGEKQRRVMDAVFFKTDMLWAQLDALYFAYVEPGFIPPGAFVPDDRK